MFRLENVSKAYDPQQPAVDDVTLELPAGRTTALIGPSGCGKSTLLRLMLGLIRPDAGAILFHGEPLPAGDGIRDLRRRVGYVIQDGGLFPHLTARRNILLAVEHAGRHAPPDPRSRLRELTDLVKLPADALDRYPQELSGGQRQRVALMRALVLDPDVLLLDEPLGALDPMIRFDLQEDLRAIFRALGKTVALVTHDLAEAGFFADQIVLMRSGRIVQRGTLGELSGRPADDFVRQFLTAQRATHLGGDGAEGAAPEDVPAPAGTTMAGSVRPDAGAKEAS